MFSVRKENKKLVEFKNKCFVRESTNNKVSQERQLYN